MPQHTFYPASWMDVILPEGIQIPSSTLISGEGGSGKPLIGFTFISSWLKQGGNVIFILTSTGKDFAAQTFSRVYNLDISTYKDQLRFIQLDPDRDIRAAPSGFPEWDAPARVNLVNPDNWDKALYQAEAEFREHQGPGTMVFGAALNLMLFSPTYGEKVLQKMQQLTGEDKNRTYLFTVSTSALADKIKVLEEAADNLMFTRNKKPMKLLLQITRIKDKPFAAREVEVPLSQQDLNTIKELAENSRGNLIPRISRI